MDREEMLETLQKRLLAGMMDPVAEVLHGLDDDNLRALIKATDGEDAVAQALAERFIFRRAAEAAMRRASAVAVGRAAAKRSNAPVEPQNAEARDEAERREEDDARADDPNEVKWP